MMMRSPTWALGRPGRVVAKSSTNSLREWEMIARFEYETFVVCGLISIASWFGWGFGLLLSIIGFVSISVSQI